MTAAPSSTPSPHPPASPAPIVEARLRARDVIACPSPVTKKLKASPGVPVPYPLGGRCGDRHHGRVAPRSVVQVRVWMDEPPEAAALAGAMHKLCPGCGMMLEIQTLPAQSSAA